MVLPSSVFGVIPVRIAELVFRFLSPRRVLGLDLFVGLRGHGLMVSRARGDGHLGVASGLSHFLSSLYNDRVRPRGLAGPSSPTVWLLVRGRHHSLQRRGPLGALSFHSLYATLVLVAYPDKQEFDQEPRYLLSL